MKKIKMKRKILNLVKVMHLLLMPTSRTTLKIMKMEIIKMIFKMVVKKIV